MCSEKAEKKALDCERKRKGGSEGEGKGEEQEGSQQEGAIYHGGHYSRP